MAENSAIEWTDHTFNPWIGCTRISPGCDNCYAATRAHRFGDDRLWNGERRRTSPANWHLPVKWNRAAERAGRRARVFCASLADVFDNQVPEDWRTDLWMMIRHTPNLDWLLLTKRPQNMAGMLPAGWGHLGFPNVWLGATVENQQQADIRIAHLLAIPAAKHFLSCGPLLGPVDLTHVTNQHGWGSVLEPQEIAGMVGNAVGITPQVDWVICEGESGPDARPPHPDWIRSLRDQCAAAGVPFFFKQWGEWAPEDAFRGHYKHHAGTPFRSFAAPGQMPPMVDVWKVGKKAAGAMLDGREHREFPA